LLERVFKTSRFSKDALKAGIGDVELCRAMTQVMAGQADDLGGGVFKKRLGGNRSRSIVLAKGRRYWFYAYLFAKKNRDNIDDAELLAFRALAAGYARLTPRMLAQLLIDVEILEICHADQDQRQRQRPIQE